MANLRFQQALQRIPHATPPVWMMRQAGRYHVHYQALRARHSFMELCKIPELACETTLGPINDFDFDVAILFSDLLFPLEFLGMGLEYTDHGPRLGWHLEGEKDLLRLNDPRAAAEKLKFQEEALRLLRQQLPADKSLIGFVGGPWTLFAYAAQGSHEGGLTTAKSRLALLPRFAEVLLPLLKINIASQLCGGAEVVMVFDTAAGELSPELYRRLVAPLLVDLAQSFPGKLGYYSKGTQRAHVQQQIVGAPWAGLGFDHRWELPEALSLKREGFVQGNFDQSLFFLPTAEFEREARRFLQQMAQFTPAQRAGWVCGLGHGVLPRTPEAHVKKFVQMVREELA